MKDCTCDGVVASRGGVGDIVVNMVFLAEKRKWCVGKINVFVTKMSVIHASFTLYSMWMSSMGAS